MASRIAVVAIDAADPRAVAAFWTAALGWQVTGEDEGIISIASADGREPGIDVVAVPEPKTGKNRLHLDLRADGSPAAEVERLLGLGARRIDIGQPADASWTVLADPEGNEFCVLSGPGGE
ncbi:VOC family protein [Arthrobacter zhaoguopingii]|uniref:VOC family protein n=1 Tax=Arthrobacter zhaoguopingii TaxID=2681491 RepID=UPI001357D3D2|nr:VOC family protein [Arthrobacter zhaoguopingii]